MVVEKRRLYLGRDKVSLAVSVDDARWNNVLSITGRYLTCYPNGCSGCLGNYVSELTYYKSAAIRLSKKKSDSGVCLCSRYFDNGRKMDKMFANSCGG